MISLKGPAKGGGSLETKLFKIFKKPSFNRSEPS